MTPEDIDSGDALAAWLRERPTGSEAERDLAYRLSVAIAHRAAMRVLPIILDSAPSQKPGLKQVLFFRLNLTAGVAAMGSRLQVAPAIERAAAAANTAHTASTDAALAGTRDATMFATNATRCAAYAATMDAAASEARAAALAAAPDAIQALMHTVTDAAGDAGHAADAADAAGHASGDASGAFLSALRTDCAAFETGSG